MYILSTVVTALFLQATIPNAPALVVRDPGVLASMENQGLSLQHRLGAEISPNTWDLARKSSWRDVVRVLSRDLNAIMRKDKRAGSSLRFAHRLFDKKWLKSKATRFELIGVVNRVDRQVFQPGKCGEVRLVYRLSYRNIVSGKEVVSRLPITLNLVYWQHPADGAQDCGEVVRRWLPTEAGLRDGDSFLSPGGPLSSESLALKNLKSLEVNIQSVRWPSTVHPSLGGHAEYILRVFKMKRGRLVPTTLENTPDVRRLKAKPSLKKKLLAWLTDPENFKALDEGVAVLPKKFLAKRSVSVTPKGLARLANRPFKQLFRERDLASVDYSQGRFVKSPAALLRRLDSRTCAGCHQSRSVAGFHMLGDDPLTMEVDALGYGHSDHLEQDLGRREQFARALMTGTQDNARGFAERLEREGRYGSRCGLGDPGFASWTCGPGLRCAHLEDAELGVCVPHGAPEIGDPCQVGKLRSKAVGHRDRVRQVLETSCGSGRVCESSPVGFPNGMCSGSCAEVGPESICGAIAVLTPFNRCLARKIPFATCITENVRPGALRKCSSAMPCRDDYICARTPTGEGACIPPYFLFQLRVDGHNVAGTL